MMSAADFVDSLQIRCEDTLAYRWLNFNDWSAENRRKPADPAALDEFTITCIQDVRGVSACVHIIYAQRLAKCQYVMHCSVFLQNWYCSCCLLLGLLLYKLVKKKKKRFSKFYFLADNAYGKTLRQFHGWVVRGVFAVSWVSSTFSLICPYYSNPLTLSSVSVLSWP